MADCERDDKTSSSTFFDPFLMDIDIVVANVLNDVRIRVDSVLGYTYKYTYNKNVQVQVQVQDFGELDIHVL